MEVNLPFLLCFTLYLRAIFQLQAPGAYIWRGDLTEGFYVTSLGGLYLEGLIHGGAYFQNFTVFLFAGLCLNGHMQWWVGGGAGGKNLYHVNKFSLLSISIVLESF